MRSRSPELDQFTRALFDEGVVLRDILPEIMQELGGPEETYSLIVPPDPKWFDAGRIADRLGKARVDELNRGMRPSPQELHWWREASEADAERGEGDCFHMVSLWRVEDEAGRTLLCAALHEDQGTIVQCLGPFSDQTEAVQALRAHGRLGP